MSYRESITLDLRRSFLKYTRAAFAAIPRMHRPAILEVGCGSGLVTVELARHVGDGHVHAIDVDGDLVSRAAGKIQEAALSDKITVERVDLLENSFKDGQFDIIWEEGVFQIIGFERCFEACHRILKKGGYLVLGQSITAMNPHVRFIGQHGFKLVQILAWPKGIWLKDYYTPLQQRLNELKAKRHVAGAPGDIDAIEAEIKMVASNPGATDCAHYIIVKI